MIVHLPDIFFPSLSANNKVSSAVSQRLAAEFVLYTYKSADNPLLMKSHMRKGDYTVKNFIGKSRC